MLLTARMGLTVVGYRRATAFEGASPRRCVGAVLDEIERRACDLTPWMQKMGASTDSAVGSLAARLDAGWTVEIPPEVERTVGAAL